MNSRLPWDKKQWLKETKVWAKTQEAVNHLPEEVHQEDLKVSTICRGFKEWLKTIQEGQECAKGHHQDIQIIAVLLKEIDLRELLVLAKVPLLGIHRDKDQAHNLDNRVRKDRDHQDLLQEQETFLGAVAKIEQNFSE